MKVKIRPKAISKVIINRDKNLIKRKSTVGSLSSSKPQLALKTSEAKFEALAESIDAAVFVVRFNQGMHALYVNPKASTITGYSEGIVVDGFARIVKS